MQKSILLIVLMLLASAQSFAQHFDWVRGYAPGDNVAIVGSVTDSVGNLYILGSINFNTCWENGSRLLPITPYGYAADDGDMLIAKVSPEGDLVWHKVIHGEWSNSIPYDIKLVGDTAFACLVTMPLASEMGYLYYLDTLIRKGGYGIYPDYPMSGLYIATGASTVTALITFDFDGNVLEQHFLYISYLDYNGDDIVRTYTQYPQPWYQAQTFGYPSFAVDGEGNIYLSRCMIDQISAGQGNNYYVENGTISAIKIWCDRRVVGVVPADSNLAFSPQIFKFSPHFDTLLESRYVFQSNATNKAYTYPFIRTDIYGDLYLLGILESMGGEANLIIVDSTRNFFINETAANTRKGYLIRFNSSLEPRYCITLDDSILSSNKISSSTGFHDIAFDYDSNLMFLCATTGRGTVGDTTSFYSILMYQGRPLEKLKNQAFIMAFRIDDTSARLHSYGVVPSKMVSDMLTSPYHEHDKITCLNNRVIIQATCMGGIHFSERNIEWPNWADESQAYIIFDYQGNVIGGECYAAFGSSNRPGSVILKDSILYLMNRFVSDATFGDIYVPYRGSYFACIAKYTDPAFMQPYRPVDTTMVVEVVQEEMTVVRYPNPTTGRLTIDMNGRPLREAWVAAIDGVAEPLPVTHLGDSRYAADLTGRPDGTYILILVADDHRTYRSTIILQH